MTTALHTNDHLHTNGLAGGLGWVCTLIDTVAIGRGRMIQKPSLYTRYPGLRNSKPSDVPV